MSQKLVPCMYYYLGKESWQADIYSVDLADSTDFELYDRLMTDIDSES